jgi:hypothetical protein
MVKMRLAAKKLRLAAKILRLDAKKMRFAANCRFRKQRICGIFNMKIFPNTLIL